MLHVDDTSDDEFGQRLRLAIHALPDAPPALQRAAIGLWPAASARPFLNAAATALLRQVAAVLSFDSWAAPALASGMRALRSTTRQLLYSAQGRDIDLRIAPVADAYALVGQVLGPDEMGSIELTRLDVAAQPAWRAQLDTLGEFRIDGLSRGVYALTLQLGGDAIVLPPVDVGEQSN
jgi:hypothetical protein